MRALVTGGNGFLGRYIVEALLARGDEVSVLGRSTYPELSTLGASGIQADIRDKAALSAACRSHDTVFHTAARVGLWGSAEEFKAVNIEGTRNMLSAAAESGVKRFVFTSSPSVAFDRSSLEGAAEDLPYPDTYQSHYPATKAAAERLVLEANGTSGMATCALRPHLVWGPRDNHLVPGILKRSRQGRLFIVGDGKNIVDFTYVENAALAHIQAADALELNGAPAGEAYFIGQDEPVYFWEFVAELLERHGLPKPTRRIPHAAARALGHLCEFAYELLPLSGEPRITPFLADQLAMSHYFSIEKARKDFGYSPSISMAEGMERLLASGTHSTNQ